MHYRDLSETSNLIRILQVVQPGEVYNFGAQMHVAVSFESPEYTADVDTMGTLSLLEAIRILGIEKNAYLLGIHQRTIWSCAGYPQMHITPSISAARTRWLNSTPTGL